VIEALIAVLSPYNLMLAFLGTLFGIILGVIPGLGPALGIALLIPVTIPLSPASGLIILGSCFGASIYGGCISAILINTPGTPGNVATTFDGYPLAEQGRAAYAIGAATVASAIGGTAGVLALALLGPPIARFSLVFGPAEFFMLAMIGLMFISRTIKGNFLRGIISAVIGLVLSFVGQDIVTGYARFTFGLEYLDNGISFIPAVIGLFAVTQAFELTEKGGTISATGTVDTREVFAGALEPFKRWKITLRSTLLGTIVGAIPGIGVSTANLLAYTEAIRVSKDPDSFGKGNIEGVIAPEAANNAVEGGSLIPTLALGIPGGAAAAVLLGGLNLFGVQIGFQLFTASSHLLYLLIGGIILSNLMFAVIGVSSVSYLAKMTVVRNEIIAPIVLVMCVIGSYTLEYSFGDVWLCLAFGIVGFILRKLAFPIVPMVIALVLGPIAEQGFIRAMLISNWSFAIFVERPITIVLLTIGFLIAVSPAFPTVWSKLRSRKGGSSD